MMTPSDLGSRRLARRLAVRPLGVGCGTSRWSPSAVQPDDARLLDSLRRALEDGAGESDAQLFDTADSLRNGHAERLLGKVLKEHRGHRAQVASKVGRIQGSAVHPYAGPRVRHQLEQTLDNLYLDELALYTLESHDFGLGDRHLDPVIDQMRALRDLGLIRAIGLRGPGFLSPACSIRRFLYLFDRIRPDVVWTQASGLLPLPRLGEGEDLGTFTARRGVGLVISSPLAHGVLAGGSPFRALAAWGGSTVGCTKAAASVITVGIAELAGVFGGSPAALARAALRFLLQQARNAVVVVGVGEEQHVGYSLRFLGEPLSKEELAVIDAVFSRVQEALIQPQRRAPAVEVSV